MRPSGRCRRRSGEFRVAGADGSDRTVLATCLPLLREDGGCDEVLLIGHDVTGERRAAAALEGYAARARPVERRAPAVRVRGEPRPAGAAPVDRQLRPAPRTALPRALRRGRGRDDRVHRRGREPHAGPDQRPARLLARLHAGPLVRRPLPRRGRGRRGPRPAGRDRRERGRRPLRRPAHGLGRPDPARPGLREPDLERDQVPAAGRPARGPGLGGPRPEDVARDDRRQRDRDRGRVPTTGSS